MAKCRWRRADNKRLPGWEAVRQRIIGETTYEEVEGQIRPVTRPALYAAHECEDFWRTMPTLQHDEKNIEDLDTDGEDHIADEVRYACMSRPWKPKIIKPPTGLQLPALPGEMTFNQIVNRNKKLRLEKEADLV